MDDTRKQKLILLGAEKLADTLLELEIHNEDVENQVNRLIDSPEKIIKRFRQKLSGLKRTRRYFDWRHSPGLADRLMEMLNDLKEAVTDPMTGVELVAGFFETDQYTLGNCDDSSGYVGDVYRVFAQELFVEYASECQEKEIIADIVLQLVCDDKYGVRDSIINRALDFLPEHIIHTLISEFQKLADNEDDEFDKKGLYIQIGGLAQQIKDAGLYEETYIACWGKLSYAAILDISQIHYDREDIESAYLWIQKIPENERFQAEKRRELLKKIYGKQGNTENLTDLLLESFRINHSMDVLNELLDVVGQEKKETIVENEITFILNRSEFKTADNGFLISVGKMDEAEQHILQKDELLNGRDYDSLLPLARIYLREERFLPATLIYRSMLVSILDRAFYKAYSYGADYLKKLDSMADRISDWKGVENHIEFKQKIYENHKRKSSFWGKYNQKCSIIQEE